MKHLNRTALLYRRLNQQVRVMVNSNIKHVLGTVLKPVPEIVPSEVKLTVFGNTAIPPLGTAEVCITTEDTDVSITLKCEIVSAETLNVPVLLNKDLLGQINVFIEKGRIKFEKPPEVNNIFTIAADAR